MSIPFDIAAISKNILANAPSSSSSSSSSDDDDDDDDEDSDHSHAQIRPQSSSLINDFLDAQLNKTSQALLPSNTLLAPLCPPARGPPSSAHDANHPIPLQSASSEFANPQPSGLPIPTASQERLDERDLSQLIHSLLDSVPHFPCSPNPHPTPERLPSPPALPLPILSGAPIDPLLESLAPSPPTTLSAPQSPQPVPRPGRSPSQQPVIQPALPPPRQPVLRQDASTSRQRLSDVASSQPPAAPPLITTCSLEQLANPPAGQQPNYPWWTIIRAAIMGSRYGMMTRDEICDALAARWTYFRSTDERATRIWKSAVGHNLSVKECFVRVYVEGEGNVSYYIVDTAVDPAKGRLSKSGVRNKAGSSNERVVIPTISRRPVLPSTLNLSAQARWSPAIAAIRNAKHGLPPVTPRPASTLAAEHTCSASDSDQSESDSDASTETDTCAVPGSRLGSSLSAIVSDAAPSRLPRLAFSRSLSNALVNPGASSRRTAAHARTPDRRPPRPARKRPSGPKKLSQPFAQRSLPIIKPRVVPVQERLLSPRPPSPQPPSLQEQVAAALADVAAKLPALVSEAQHDQPPDPRPTPHQPPLPTFSIENLVKEVQAEFAAQEGSSGSETSEDSSSSAEDTEESDSETEVGAGSLAPTAADFDRLLASVVGGGGEGGQEEQLSDGQEHKEGEDGRRPKRSADDAGLGNLLQSLIDEATQTGAGGGTEDECSESESDASEEPALGATRLLDAEIAAAQERAAAAARAARLSTSLAGVVELTASGDIPVHPLPAGPAQLAPEPPRCAPPVTRARAAAPRASPRRAARGASLARATSDAASVDRRTKASGTRTLGRRLNLPLPSSHTGVDERVDDTALAPSLLESIQVVTTERPRATFPELAKEAILTHPGGKMTAAEIFKVVEKKYPFFVNRPDSWKATLRNVLTSHSCFVKIPRPVDAPGRGDWWATVDLPLWKKRRTTAKAKMDEDFLGRHAREQLSKGRGAGLRRSVGVVVEAEARVAQVEVEARVAEAVRVAEDVGTGAGAEATIPDAAPRVGSAVGS